MNKMNKLIRTTILSAIASITVSTSAWADHGSDDNISRSTVEAVCESESANFMAIVTNYNGYPVLEVYDGYRLVEKSYADKNYSYSGGTLIVSYSTGPVTQGGVSLRIRSFDHDARNLEGFGHLTLKSGRRFVNKLMSCFIY